MWMEEGIPMDEHSPAQNKPESAEDEFSDKIGRLSKSRAYLDYCEEVYGYRIYLFNMTDQEQLDFIFNSVSLSPDDTLLDLGCGSGSILNLLVKKYGCSGIGMDRLSGDLVEQNRSWTYLCGDIDRISDYRLKPTVTLSVDCLFFSSGLDKLLRHLSGLQGNRMYLFYSQYLFEENPGDRSALHGDHTKIADILNKNGISYKTIEYSKNERLLYKKSLAALENRREDFIKEGNSDLYENKLKEDRLGYRLYEEGRASRYLYIVEPAGSGRTT
jgi:SAM-dependent methyltransferase